GIGILILVDVAIGGWPDADGRGILGGPAFRLGGARTFHEPGPAWLVGISSGFDPAFPRRAGEPQESGEQEGGAAAPMTERHPGPGRPLAPVPTGARTRGRPKGRASPEIAAGCMFLRDRLSRPLP